ncbi:Hypothetical protein LUCI_4321 [Lucifera butyrica]|uniref:Lipoprotein n=1 Tax=Lucifera butyrica TaxID=1351585 RepID=A0A498RDJ2_9FIRM|nr:hypothetical protein [Lucifera butyrica]VBB09035.1 Hypothetical protein LUCI_4321 [Lucifera butyrica]
MNKINRVILPIITVMLLVISTGCFSGTAGKSSAVNKPSKPQVLDTGKIEGSVYKNDYFGLTMNIPENWSIQNDEAKNEMKKTGEKLLTDSDEAKKAGVERSIERTVNLLSASKYPLGTPNKVNANMLVMAEKVSAFPGIKTGKDYLLNAKKMLESSRVKFTFKDITSEKIDGLDFSVLECIFKVQDKQITQKYYAAVIRDYALVFNMTYVSSEDLATLNKAISTVKFEK